MRRKPSGVIWTFEPGVAATGGAGSGFVVIRIAPPFHGLGLRVLDRLDAPGSPAAAGAGFNRLRRLRTGLFDLNCLVDLNRNAHVKRRGFDSRRLGRDRPGRRRFEADAQSIAIMISAIMISALLAGDVSMGEAGLQCLDRRQRFVQRLFGAQAGGTFTVTLAGQVSDRRGMAGVGLGFGMQNNHRHLAIAHEPAPRHATGLTVMGLPRLALVVTPMTVMSGRIGILAGVRLRLARARLMVGGRSDRQAERPANAGFGFSVGQFLFVWIIQQRSTS
jgi:hypothetical protein